MQPRLVRIVAIALLAVVAVTLPASRSGSGIDGGRSIGAPEASLLIPAKTRLIISFSRRALA